MIDTTTPNAAAISAADFLRDLYGPEAEGYVRLEFVGPDISESFKAAADPLAIVGAALHSYRALHVEFDALRYAAPERWESEKLDTRFLWAAVPHVTALDLAFYPLLPTYVVTRRLAESTRLDVHGEVELYWCLNEQCAPAQALKLSHKLAGALGALPASPGHAHALHIPGTRRRLGWADYVYELAASTGARYELAQILATADPDDT